MVGTTPKRHFGAPSAHARRRVLATKRNTGHAFHLARRASETGIAASLGLRLPQLLYCSMPAEGRPALAVRTDMYISYPKYVTWSYGVTVSTLDSESSDRGSNPRRTLLFSLSQTKLPAEDANDDHVCEAEWSGMNATSDSLESF